MELPAELWQPQGEFVADYVAKAADGAARLASSRIAFVGLARNCGPALANNLAQARDIGAKAREWTLHIESNDCTDNTLDVLAAFCDAHRQAGYRYQALGRQHYGAEFAGRRTIALAEYRAACQEWVRDNAADLDYVIAIDWDAWGGFNGNGLLNGLGWLVELPGAFGMASVSLAQAPTLTMGQDRQTKVVPGWTHYDAWALRGVGQPSCYWDDYRAGSGGWKHHWLPPVGSCPALVSSAFGGCCIYRTGAYLAGTYAGEHDCEHVPFHRSIAERTGQHLYLCPSMRTVMSWMEPADAGDGVNRVPDVPGDAA